MTLCKYRPQRTYDAQYIFEQNDVTGLRKMMREAAENFAELGLASTLYYIGAMVAFDLMFDMAKGNGEVDTWQDFIVAFENVVQKLEEEIEGGEE